MPPPHMVPGGVTVTSDYYVRHVLSADVLPKIRAEANKLNCSNWAFMQDLAPAHTANQTIAYLRAEKTKVSPWFPKGADINPLDVMVWGSLQKKLRAVPIEMRNNPGEVGDTLTEIADGLRGCPERLNRVRRRRRHVPPRQQWAR